MSQPPPMPNNSRPIWEQVIEDMHKRDELGMQRYGVRLQAHNGRDALVDAYEEALDLVVYLRQEIAERGEQKLHFVGELESQLREADATVAELKAKCESLGEERDFADKVADALRRQKGELLDRIVKLKADNEEMKKQSEALKAYAVAQAEKVNALRSAALKAQNELEASLS